MLVVDDRDHNLVTMRSILEPLDVEIVLATSGTEALKHLLRDDFAVILMDVSMPIMDGYETAAEIKKRVRTRDVPILFLTALEGSGDHVLRGFSTGAVDYITKPIDPWMLRAKVDIFIQLHNKNKLLRHQRALLQDKLRKVENEIAERRIAEAALRKKSSIVELVKNVAIAVNEANTIEEALNVVVGALCAHTGWPVGHAYVVDPEDDHLILSTGAWFLADEERFSVFKKATEALARSSSLGFAQHVLQQGEPHWAVDLASDRLFSRKAEATAAGLRSGFAIPIKEGPRVSGIVELFASHIARPDSDLLEVMNLISNQLGRFFERRRFEDDLVRLDAMKSEFIANAAHELRTPLSAITGAAEVLAAGEDAEGFAASLEIVRRQTSRVRSLVNNLLDLTALEYERLNLNLGPVDLQAAVTAALAVVPAPEGRDIELDLPAKLQVLAEPTRLDQVLVNLIDNAYKYGIGKVWISARSQGRNVMIAVRNEGPPVEDALAGTLFDPFTRGEETGAVRGSGLGLAVCRGLVDAFGGQISYTAEEDGIVAFKLNLLKG